MGRHSASWSPVQKINFAIVTGNEPIRLHSKMREAQIRDVSLCVAAVE
jgi:hypothetical protein